MKTIDCDYLVIGAGLAGLAATLQLATSGKRIVLCAKRDLSESNSSHAQGGIAVPIASGDTIEAHLQDTLVAGAGLTNPEAARTIIADGAARIRDLEQWGVRFDSKPRKPHRRTEYDLGQEGGHSARRILHSGDITGADVIRVLVERVRELSNVEVHDRYMAIDLITTSWLRVSGENACIGCYFLDMDSSEVLAVRAPHTILATGGAGKVYLYTCNPDAATGDGVAMAWRAGLPIRNMEFVQFHPTCLYHPQAKSFLISEAVRGEGAHLLNGAGERFMPRYDERLELAPRDIVARAIDHEMKTRGDSCVYLDITHRPASFLRQRFPNIYRECRKYGFDMTRQPLPVVPAAHYFCGGLAADTSGRTDMAGLHAVGEVSCTGLHGANRLASNSLLEALVCGHRAALDILEHPLARHKIRIPDWTTGGAVPSDEAVVVAHNWDEVRTVMWDYVGIVRTNRRLSRALRRISNLRREIRAYYHDYLITADLLELRNIAAVAELVIRSAMTRRESRGLHYTLDYPLPVPAMARDTVIHDLPGGGAV